MPFTFKTTTFLLYTQVCLFLYLSYFIKVNFNSFLSSSLWLFSKYYIFFLYLFSAFSVYNSVIFYRFFLNMIIFLQSRFLINLCFLFKKKYLVVNLISVHRILYFDINSKWYINLKYFSLILFLILGLAKYT